MVILIHPKSKAEIVFEDEHAKRLLSMPNNGGWKEKQIPGSELVPELTKEKQSNAITGKRNKGNTKGARKQAKAKATD